jgi:copper homeostasis protein
MNYQLEVCAFGVQSCIIAQRAGAVRVELCDNPIEGGTTPSYGTIKKVRDQISIQLYPIIRPRSLNYFYDEHEWEIIKEDIRICNELQCDGISAGVQKKDGTLDADRLKEIVDLAYPMKVTCNRVFDAVPNPFDALEVLIMVGCERVLTSGLAASAPEGSKLLKQLVDQSAGRISIMPGAGVRSHNLGHLAKETGAYEFHSSARKPVANPVTFTNSLVTDAGSMVVADEEDIQKMVSVLKNLNHSG